MFPFMHPAFFPVTLFYDSNYKAYVLKQMIPPVIHAKLKGEDFLDLPCPCGCGRSHTVITKETLEEVIALLAAQRIADLN